MSEKYYKLVEGEHRYEYEDLDYGDLFLSGHNEELYIKTEKSAILLLDGKEVGFKGTHVVYPCKLVETNIG